MSDWKKISAEIIESFFKQTRDYVAQVLRSNDDYMKSLHAYYERAWTVPKNFKGNSSGMGFVPELLVFEAVRQHLEKKYGFSFSGSSRSMTSDNRTETAYFVDGNEPTRLLVQGLRIRSNPYGYPPTDFQHDVTYLVKDTTWKVKAVIEVKGYFESSSLKGDIDKLEHAEKSYPNADEALFAFIGFASLSGPARAIIRPFAEKKSHYIVLPGICDPAIGIIKLEDLLDKL